MLVQQFDIRIDLIVLLFAKDSILSKVLFGSVLSQAGIFIRADYKCIFKSYQHKIEIIHFRAPLETFHVSRLPICCDAGKALSPTVGLEALPWREQRRQRTASGKSFKTKHFWF